MIILLNLFCLSRRVRLITHARDFYLFCIHLCWNNRIIHRTACTQHCICYVSIINLYIVSAISWGCIYLYFYIVLPVFYRLTLTQCQNICTSFFHRLFWETYRSLVIFVLCHQLHFSREKHITSKGKSDTLEISIL